MNRNRQIGALAISSVFLLTAGLAMAGHQNDVQAGQKATQTMQQNNITLTRAIQIAEEHTNGKALAAEARFSSMGEMRGQSGMGRSGQQSHQEHSGQSGQTWQQSGQTGQQSGQTGEHSGQSGQTGEHSGQSGQQSGQKGQQVGKLQFQVTCLVDNNSLKVVTIDAQSAQVQGTRVTNTFGTSDMSMMAGGTGSERYAADEQFRAGTREYESRGFGQPYGTSEYERIGRDSRYGSEFERERWRDPRDMDSSGYEGDWRRDRYGSQREFGRDRDYDRARDYDRRERSTWRDTDRGGYDDRDQQWYYPEYRERDRSYRETGRYQPQRSFEDDYYRDQDRFQRGMERDRGARWSGGTGGYESDRYTTGRYSNRERYAGFETRGPRGQMHYAKDIVGATVRNNQDEELGRIENLAVDPDRGCVVYAVLSHGGFLGMGDKLFAVPWKAVQIYDEDRARLNVDRETLANAPGFDEDNWPNMANQRWARNVQGYYAQVGDIEDQPPARQISKSSDIIGKEVRNHQDEDLGKVENLVIDASNGKIAYAVVAFGGFLGLGDKLFAVPWAALTLSGDELLLDIDKNRLSQAEGFQRGERPNLSDRNWATRVHQFYGVPPYWMDESRSGRGRDTQRTRDTDWMRDTGQRSRDTGREMYERD